ncbi:MAG: hypothetical protein HC829_07450 [Bacteroidales bacterium]|nr:hypothetical protein [Bacteroidales bacterium]
MKAAAGRSPVTLIARDFDPAARVRLREAGLSAVHLKAALVADEPGMDRLVPERIEATVRSTAAAPTSEMAAPARLQISRGRRTLRLDGRDVVLSLTGFDAFLAAAEKIVAGDVMLTYQEIYALTRRASHRDVVNELRDQFQKHGLTREEAFALVKTVHGRGLTVGLPAGDVDIRD